MSETELETVVDGIVATLPEKSMKMMGKVMGELKAKHNGLFDGKMASNIVKKCLSK